MKGILEGFRSKHACASTSMPLVLSKRDRKSHRREPTTEVMGHPAPAFLNREVSSAKRGYGLGTGLGSGIGEPPPGARWSILAATISWIEVIPNSDCGRRPLRLAAYIAWSAASSS